MKPDDEVIMKSQFVLAGTAAAMVSLLLPVHAAPEQPSFQIAQQRPNPDADKQPQREQRQQTREQRQERRQDAQEQKQKAQPPRPAVRDSRQDQRQERREDVRERAQQRRDDVRERRQDQREDARERTQERREDVRERAKDRREDVREHREDAQRARRLEDLRQQRREVREGNRTVIREPGRTIIREDGRTIIRHDEVDRFRRFGGRDLRVERRGNETFSIVPRPGGYHIVTVTGPDGRLVRRVRRYPNGREVVIIDNRPRAGAVGFFVRLPPPVIRIPRNRYVVVAAAAPPALLYETLTAPPVERLQRAYSLDEIRYSDAVRDRMPRIDIDTITFDTGSWEVRPQEAARLEPIAQGMLKAIEKNPEEVFLIEGHTDAVGEEDDNLSLSDRRAEAVAIALTEQYRVPPENLTTQGYGEQQPKVATDGPERANRRVTVRRITPLLAGKGEASDTTGGGG
jgi:outer membrane protein OmpA-like peptidoglycan-associated protein